MHLEAKPGIEPLEQAVNEQNPWPGLSAFTEENSHFFFGRDKEADELFRLIKRETLTVLFGLSGLGKTSLLQAGVFPALRREAFLPVYVRLDYSPGVPDLVTQVKELLRDAASKEDIIAPPVRDNEVLWAYFHRTGNDFLSMERRTITPVLVFDQFEEMFTLGANSEECQRQITNLLIELGDLIENRPPASMEDQMLGEDEEAFSFYKKDYKVVFTLREDFLANLEDLCSRLPSIRHNRFRLQKMNGAQALDVVSKGGGRLVDRDVAERIVKIVAGREYAATSTLVHLEIEPTLLSVFCRELNNSRVSHHDEKISAQMLLGSREAIMTGFYERALHGLDPRLRNFIEDRLLTGGGYRNNLDLQDALTIPGVTREAIFTLIDRRLLRIEETARMPRIELTHDVLTDVIKKSRDERKVRESGDEVRAKDIQLRAAKKRNLRLRVVAIVAVLGVIVSVWQMIVAKRAESDARDARDVIKHVNDNADDSMAYTLTEMDKQLTGLGRVDLMEGVARDILSRLAKQHDEEQSPLSNTQLHFRMLACRTLADVLKSKADPGGAEKQYLASLADAKELADRNPWRFEREYAEALSGPSNPFKYGSLADLYSSQGKYNDVEKLYLESQDVSDRVARRGDADDKHSGWPDQQNANLLGRNADRLRSLGRINDALKDATASLALRKKVADGKTDDEEKQLDLANAHFRVAMLEFMLGELAQSVPNFKQSLDLRNKYIGRDPDINLHRLKFYSDLTLDRTLAMEGQVNQALATLTMSAQEQQGLAAQAPSNKEMQRDVAFGDVFLGNMYRALGQWGPALDKFNLSADVLRKGSQLDSKNVIYRNFGPLSTMYAGDAQLGLHAPDAALVNYQSAVERFRQLTSNAGTINPEWLRNLALAEGRQAYVYFLQGSRRLATNGYHEALATFLRTAQIDKENPNTFNAAAWLLATCPVDAVRNGKEALQFAQTACSLSGRGYWEYIDTLAAAEAESGDFDHAVADETAARTLIDPSDTYEIAGIDARLALYQAKRPYHMAAADLFTNWDR